MESLRVLSTIFGALLKVVAVALIILVIYRVAVSAYDFGYQMFDQEPMSSGNGRTVTVTVTEDMSPMEIGELFERKGLIDNTWLFVAQYYVSEYREDVIPGTYDLSTSMTVEEMMEYMASGGTLEEAQ